MSERAWAKLNLTLDVLGARADGYHDLRMVMETVDLWDELSFSHEGRGVTVRTNLKFLPNDQSNLAAAAALRFGEATGCEVGPLAIALTKNIPVCAGMAGGSSDAAAVLRYLNRATGADLPTEELCRIGAQVGSDVPYCVLGGTALAEGRGERLTPLPRLPRCALVLCKPPFGVSTPMLFQELDRRKTRCRPDTAGLIRALEAGELTGVAQRVYNVFEEVLPKRWGARVAEIKAAMLRFGALGTAMTGTGPTVFGIFDDDDRAREASEELKKDWPDVFFTHNV